MTQSNKVSKNGPNKKTETEEPICQKGEKICFDKSKAKKGEDPACPHSPCPVNLYDFGTHRRIIEHYTKNQQWDDAFYYFTDLESKFPIFCEVNNLDLLLEENQERETSVDCQLYIEIKHLSTYRKSIYRDLGLGIENLSSQGKKRLEENKLDFDETMDNCIIRLKHLAKAKKQDLEELKAKREYQIQITKAQMGNLKPESLEMPIQKEVEDATQQTTEEKKKSKPKSKKNEIKKKSGF